jgi:predicted Ser/Thr protein kinase
MPLTAGQRLGPYAIDGLLGAGGMGEVYKARDTRLDRTVAIKVLPSDVAADKESRERFQREARSISSLEHPNVCALYDVGEADGRAYLVMQYLDGSPLSERLRKGPLPTEQALRIAIDISNALDAAHRHGIVHRDVKPGNIMLTSSGAKLLDFGLAKQQAIVSGVSIDPATGAASGQLTAAGTIVGTLHYMAPEQVRGEPTDTRSDIYAFGAVLYEMFSGKPPFSATDPASLIGAILNRAPPPLTPPPESSRIERAIRVCLEKEAGDRWQSARDLSRELRWIAEEGAGGAAVATAGGTAARLGRRTWLIAAGATLLTLGASWAMWGRGASVPVPPVPVVVMMDSPHPQRVYDTLTLRAGGTNADDLTDILGDLPLVLQKETTGPSWHRELQVLEANPDLILVHRSCFYDATLLRDPNLDEKYFPQIYPWAADKLESLLGYVAIGNPRTRFVVYSRGSWPTDSASNAWVATMERRFPQLAGRLVAYKVPLTRATFRNRETGAEIRELALAQLRKSGRIP